MLFPHLPPSSSSPGFPLPSRFPSSSSQPGQTPTRRPPPTANNASSPSIDTTYQLLTPTWEFGGLERPSFAGLLPADVRTGAGGQGTRLGGGLGWKARMEGSQGVDTRTVFAPVVGPSGLPSGKAVSTSSIAFKRRSSSMSTTSSSPAKHQSPSSSSSAVVDRAFLSNPFLSPITGRPLACFPPTTSTTYTRQSSKLSVVTPPLDDDAYGESSPLQPPTPPYIPPPAVDVAFHSGSNAQPPLMTTTTTASVRLEVSAERTALTDRLHTLWAGERTLAGLKRKRTLLASSAEEEDEDAQELAGSSAGALSQVGVARKGSKRMRRPDRSIERGPPQVRGCPPSRFPNTTTTTAIIPQAPKKIILRLPTTLSPSAPPPASSTHPHPTRLTRAAPPSTGSTSRRKRRISISSENSSEENEQEMANVEALLVSHPPALVDPPSKVLGFGQQPSVGQSVNARQRAPSPTMPLLTVARSLRSRQTLPLSKVKELNTSLSSTLSPAVSLPDDDPLSPAELTPAVPKVEESNAEDIRSRSSSPLTSLADDVGLLDEDENEGGPAAGGQNGLGWRTFPADVDLSLRDVYPRWYRQFHVPTTVDPSLAQALDLPATRLTGGSKLNEILSKGPADLYAPRAVRGVGPDKTGACPVCKEDAGLWEFFKTKVSAFNFHMLYAHGISPTTGLPFSPPVRFRTADRAQARPDEKASMREGLCHKCQQWIAVEGVKNVQVRVPEIYWYRHAKSCHGSSRMEGDKDVWVPSPLLTRLINHVDSLDEDDKEGWIVPSDVVSHIHT